MKVTSDGKEYEVKVYLKQVATHTYRLHATLICYKGECGLGEDSPPFLIDDYYNVYEEYLVMAVKSQLMNLPD